MRIRRFVPEGGYPRFRAVIAAGTPVAVTFYLFGSLRPSESEEVGRGEGRRGCAQWSKLSAFEFPVLANQQRLKHQGLWSRSPLYRTGQLYVIENKPSDGNSASAAPNGKAEISLTREAVLTATLKSLDTVADAVTGERLPRTSRERAIHELIALVAYAVGRGIDPNDFCAVGELLRALDDAQRGNPHPMLVPEARPVDPRHDDGRKKGGRSSRDVRGLLDLADAVLAMNTLVFQGGYRRKDAAKAVEVELKRQGLRPIPWAKTARCAREEIASKRHERAARECPRDRPTVWVSEQEQGEADVLTAMWTMPAPPATGMPPSPEAVMQHRYDAYWPFAVEHCRRLSRSGDTSAAARQTMEEILRKTVRQPGDEIAADAASLIAAGFVVRPAAEAQ